MKDYVVRSADEVQLRKEIVRLGLAQVVPVHIVFVRMPEAVRRCSHSILFREDLLACGPDMARATVLCAIEDPSVGAEWISTTEYTVQGGLRPTRPSRSSGPYNARQIDVTVAEKWCSLCEETKPASEFHRLGKSLDGLQAYCKLCVKLQVRSSQPRGRPKRK